MDEETKRDHVCFGFQCWGCDAPLLMAFDTDDGRAPFRFNGPGAMVVACKQCGERHAYRREEFKRFVIRASAPSLIEIVRDPDRVPRPRALAPRGEAALRSGTNSTQL